MSKKIIRVQDQHNDNKVWIVKRYNCGNYYVNQEIQGKMFYSKFQKTTKKFFEELEAAQPTESKKWDNLLEAARQYADDMENVRHSEQASQAYFDYMDYVAWEEDIF